MTLSGFLGGNARTLLACTCAGELRASVQLAQLIEVFGLAAEVAFAVVAFDDGLVVYVEVVEFRRRSSLTRRQISVLASCERVGQLASLWDPPHP